MTIDVLKGMESQDFVHLPLYDLQSFFFVFIWICIGFERPLQSFKNIPDVLRSWIENNPSIIAATKHGQVVDPKGYLTRWFPPYFCDLAKFAEEFCEAVLFRESIT
jgi:hypothetical protein